ncbi:hypothetical protein QYF61_009171 [Mycteria americana]|uniref:Uncharacterized protein n=1 Tax=Mycteria americana TaxID=33587 RepID=A0AAN7MW88_MYCAM|nr:hypothetical protein QYF61_009171 [Mycteria americana]
MGGGEGERAAVWCLAANWVSLQGGGGGEKKFKVEKSSERPRRRGAAPEHCKRAYVIPIFKKVKKEDLGN